MESSGFSTSPVCEMLIDRGVLVKDAHEHTVRLAPPIVIDERDLAYAVDQLSDVVARTPAHV